MEKTAIIVSATSDIGGALAQRWLQKKWRVLGTYRTPSRPFDNLVREGLLPVACDLADIRSLDNGCAEIKRSVSSWDVLVLAPGTLDPVGPFLSTSFSQWNDSILVNFLAQIRIVHELLPVRKKSSTGPGPCVLFFAGGGTNNATVNSSAYTVAKISLTKMCELLDAEVADTRFTILGPGWVKTKIHDATVNAGPEGAGENLDRLRDVENRQAFTPMDQVLDACEWAVAMPRNVIGGRNFSIVSDRWGDRKFENDVAADPDLFKLRRYGNEVPSLKKNQR